MYTPPQQAFSPHISRGYTAQQNSQPVNSEWPVSHRALAARAGLPLHPRVEHPQDEVKDAVIAQFALWTTLGHREVRQDKCVELWFGELDRNRCRYRLVCRGAHCAMASWEKWEGELGKRITLD